MSKKRKNRKKKGKGGASSKPAQNAVAKNPVKVAGQAGAASAAESHEGAGAGAGAGVAAATALVPAKPVVTSSAETDFTKPIFNHRLLVSMGSIYQQAAALRIRFHFVEMHDRPKEKQLRVLVNHFKLLAQDDEFAPVIASTPENRVAVVLTLNMLLHCLYQMCCYTTKKDAEGKPIYNSDKNTVYLLANSLLEIFKKILPDWQKLRSHYPQLSDFECAAYEASLVINRIKNLRRDKLQINPKTSFPSDKVLEVKVYPKALAELLIMSSNSTNELMLAQAFYMRARDYAPQIREKALMFSWGQFISDSICDRWRMVTSTWAVENNRGVQKKIRPNRGSVKDSFFNLLDVQSHMAEEFGEVFARFCGFLNRSRKARFAQIGKAAFEDSSLALTEGGGSGSAPPSWLNFLIEIPRSHKASTVLSAKVCAELQAEIQKIEAVLEEGKRLEEESANHRRLQAIEADRLREERRAAMEQALVAQQKKLLVVDPEVQSKFEAERKVLDTFLSGRPLREAQKAALASGSFMELTNEEQQRALAKAEKLKDDADLSFKLHLRALDTLFAGVAVAKRNSGLFSSRLACLNCQKVLLQQSMGILQTVAKQFGFIDADVDKSTLRYRLFAFELEVLRRELADLNAYVTKIIARHQEFKARAIREGWWDKVDLVRSGGVSAKTNELNGLLKKVQPVAQALLVEANGLKEVAGLQQSEEMALIKTENPVAASSTALVAVGFYANTAEALTQANAAGAGAGAALTRRK